MSDAGTKTSQDVIATNADDGATLIHSYVTLDRKHTFCIYDAPTPRSRPPRAMEVGLPPITAPVDLIALTVSPSAECCPNACDTDPGTRGHDRIRSLGRRAFAAAGCGA